jgi:tetratricopeptide (TPR) repeat protein
MAASPPAASKSSRTGLLLVLVILLGGAGVWIVRQAGAPDRGEALFLFEQREWAKAEPLLAELHRRAPEDLEVLKALSVVALNLNQEPQAAGYLQRWRQLDPHDPEPLQLGMTLFRKHQQYRRALAYARELGELRPDDLDLREKLAELHFLERELSEAEKECRAILTRDPGRKRMVTLLAQCLRDQERPEEAAALLDGLLAADPEHTPALMARALLWSEAGSPERAIPLLEKVVSLDPRRQRSAKYHLSVALGRSGRHEEAAKVLAEVRKLQDADILSEDSPASPTNLELQIRAARAQDDIGNTAQAMAIAQEVLERDVDYAPAHVLLAELFRKKGDVNRATYHERRAKERP